MVDDRDCTGSGESWEAEVLYSGEPIFLGMEVLVKLIPQMSFSTVMIHRSPLNTRGFLHQGQWLDLVSAVREFPSFLFCQRFFSPTMVGEKPQLWWFWILHTKTFQTTLCALFSCIDSFISTVVRELKDDNPSSINVSTLLGGTISAHVAPQHSSLYPLVVEKDPDPVWQKLAGILYCGEITLGLLSPTGHKNRICS